MGDDSWTVVWSGATWRTYPQPLIGSLERDHRPLTDEVRAYFLARPEQWCPVGNIRRYLDTTADRVFQVLSTLVQTGDVEKQQHREPSGSTRVVYRLTVRPVVELPRHYPKMSAKYQAAKRALAARLQGDA